MAIQERAIVHNGDDDGGECKLFKVNEEEEHDEGGHDGCPLHSTLPFHVIH